MPTEVLTAILTAIVTVGLFIVKEQIEAVRSRRQAEQERVDAFRAYTSPLLRASYSLYYRIKEIFKQEAKFLLNIAPNNNYYQYRYISTLYRLAVVLGWLRALTREMAGMDLGDREKYKDIIDAVETFRASLYKSQLMEGARVEYLARKWGIDISELPKEDHNFLEGQIRQIIWDTLADEDANYAYELDDEKQLQLLQKVGNLIAEIAQQPPPEKSLLKDFFRTAIRAISRTESWIYRDWQQAIGDVMLVPSESSNTRRRFEVMGFQQFEDMYLKQLKNKKDPLPEHRWISRIDSLFQDLDVKNDDKFDARIQQLRNIGSTLLDLIQILDDLEPDAAEYASGEKLEQLIQFDKEECNPVYHQMKEEKRNKKNV